jgi:hypothetical protein
MKYNEDAIDGWTRRTEKDLISEYREQREADFNVKLAEWKKAAAQRKKQQEKEKEQAGGINDSMPSD